MSDGTKIGDIALLGVFAYYVSKSYLQRKWTNLRNYKVLHQIPEGDYCYTMLESPSSDTEWRMIVKHCPYWGLDERQQEQCNGFCSYEHKYDWIDGTDLWDSLKVCGINDKGDII
jgi:hypothetical protein